MGPKRGTAHQGAQDGRQNQDGRGRGAQTGGRGRGENFGPAQGAGRGYRGGPDRGGQGRGRGGSGYQESPPQQRQQQHQQPGLNYLNILKFLMLWLSDLRASQIMSDSRIVCTFYPNYKHGQKFVLSFLVK